MDRVPELRHLRYFVAVAEELHFGRAAARLHMAQPPLSQQVRALEALIGTPLFVRTSRSVALTPAGTVYLERCRRVLAQVRDDAVEAGRIGRGELGRFDIGFVNSAIQLGLPARVRRFRELFPDVELRLREGFTASIVRRLLAGEVDLAVVRDAEPHPDLVATELATEEFTAIVPLDHPWAGRASMTAAALRDDPFVFPPRTAGELAYQRLLQPCREAGFAPLIVQEAANWFTIVQLVSAGLGVTIAPRGVGDSVPPGARAVALTGTRARTEVHVLRRRGDERVTSLGFAAGFSEPRPIAGGTGPDTA